MSDAPLVLVVDDEPSIRLMFRTALQTAGYLASEASGGSSALVWLREKSADLMLLDLKMPGMDGMETLRRMRERGDETPVVIITAHGSIPDAVAAMKLGAVDFLPKPVTPERLRQVVAEVIARHRGSGTDTASAFQPRPQHVGSVQAAEPLTSTSTVVVETAAPVVDLAAVKRALNKREFARAEQLLEELLDAMPLSPAAHTLMGVLHECLGQPHAAYQSYRTALQCAPNYVPALNNLRRYCEQYGLEFQNKAINPAAP
jgi:two-component system, OmpR family, phosphate regulon response regulator OmpR